MVSVMKIGQNINFSSNNKPIIKDGGINKKEVKSFAESQKNMGYAAVGAGALALAGSLLKNKTMNLITAAPAAFIATTLGVNMIMSGKAVNEAVNKHESLETTPKPDNK